MYRNLSGMLHGILDETGRPHEIGISRKESELTSGISESSLTSTSAVLG